MEKSKPLNPPVSKKRSSTDAVGCKRTMPILCMV